MTVEEETNHAFARSLSNAGLGFPAILDACCGGRQFWFDKENPDVLFADCRVMPPKVVGSGKDARVRRWRRVSNRMPYNRPTFNDPHKLSVGALSQQFPLRLIELCMPYSTSVCWNVWLQY